MGFTKLEMRCRSYKRKDRQDRWVVTLYWRGHRYYRTNYDDNEPLSSARLAHRISEAINSDLETKGKAFDPRVWFQSKDSDFNFKNYAEKWLIKNLSRYAPSCRREINKYIETAITFLGRLDIREIRYGTIEDYLNSLPAHLSPKSKKSYLTALHKIFSDAYAREEINRVPGWPKIRIEDTEVKWIDREWQDKIIEAIPKQDQPIFVFIRTYGCRPGEARALQWDCIDFDKRIIVIKRTFSGSVLQEHTKTHRIRYFPMAPHIEDLLKSIRGISGFVFRNQFGRPYLADLSKKWNTARDSVGAPDVNLYQGTRHSLASQLVNDNVPLEFISKLYGHTQPQMTKRYAHVSVEAMRRVIEGK